MICFLWLYANVITEIREKSIKNVDETQKCRRYRLFRLLIVYAVLCKMFEISNLYFRLPRHDAITEPVLVQRTYIYNFLFKTAACIICLSLMRSWFGFFNNVTLRIIVKQPGRHSCWPIRAQFYKYVSASLKKHFLVP